MINLSRQGAGNIMLILVYSAIYNNNLDFFDETIGQNMISVIQDMTGLTLDDLIQFVNTKKNLSTETSLATEPDFENMTIKELSEKYGLSETTVRNYANKNHKHYKKSIRTREELENEVVEYFHYTRGMCTISELSRSVGTNYASAKAILSKYNLKLFSA